MLLLDGQNGCPERTAAIMIPGQKHQSLCPEGGVLLEAVSTAAQDK